MAAPKVVSYSRPQAGDVVLCRFPEDIVDPEPSLKPRPAIIVKVSEPVDGDASYHVHVCYGSTQIYKAKGPYAWDVLITDPGEMAHCGLAEPTRFDLSTIIQLDYNSEWFLPPWAKPFGATPKMGALPPVVSSKIGPAFKAAKAAGK
ncbi:MAG: hypothetical protein ACREVL_14210 [Solimonas sp.]